MDIYLPINEAAQVARVEQAVILRAIESGRIRAAMMNGAYIVNRNDLNQPLVRENTPEYQAVLHLKGVRIGVRQAAEKYRVPNPTISRWIDRGLIQRLSGEVLRGQRVMIDEADVAYCAAIYHQNPGQGKTLFNPDGTPYKKDSQIG